MPFRTAAKTQKEIVEKIMKHVPYNYVKYVRYKDSKRRDLILPWFAWPHFARVVPVLIKSSDVREK